jgi:hypothetical protein
MRESYRLGLQHHSNHRFAAPARDAEEDAGVLLYGATERFDAKPAGLALHQRHSRSAGDCISRPALISDATRA